jgi:tetratricopeptide (TPR) repeat protein
VITNRHLVTLEMEFIKWVLLAILAAALVLVLATVAAADPMLPEPARLPGDMNEIAQPIVPDVKPFFPEMAPYPVRDPADVAARIWMTLEHQRAGCVAEALAGWQGIYLGGGAEIWREIAMGAAYLQAADVDQAALHLDAARAMNPEHPVVAYYTGILRLEQAAAAVRVPDDAPGLHLRMVAFVPERGEQARQQYQLEARQELLMAIAGADMIWLDERLVIGDRVEEEMVVPRVGDLLVALGADNFVGQAHHLLFGVELDLGATTAAEEHLDLAVATGIAPLLGYEELAEAYLEQDQPADALRATRKDIAANYPQLWQAGQEMKAALEKMREGFVW